MMLETVSRIPPKVKTPEIFASEISIVLGVILKPEDTTLLHEVVQNPPPSVSEAIASRQ